MFCPKAHFDKQLRTRRVSIPFVEFQRGTESRLVVKITTQPPWRREDRKGTMIFREESDGKYVQGVLFFQGDGPLYEAKLDEECFALLKKATAIIAELEHMPRIKEDRSRLIALDEIDGTIFTIAAAADTLPRRARTPNLHNIENCAIFLSGAIPWLANATGYHQKVEELRSIASYFIQLALDSMEHISRYEHRRIQELLYYRWRPYS